MQLKQRSDIHWLRKVWHCCGVLVLVVLFHNISRPTAIISMSLATMFFVGIDIVRQYSKKLNTTMLVLFGPVMREHERQSLAGTSYLLIGVLLIMILFPKDIVSLSLLFLAVADPLASFVGLRIGKDKIIGQKSLQGSMAAFFACTIIAAVFFYSKGIMTERIMVVSLLAGLIGAISELLPVGRLDDNFTFPIVCSSLLYMLLWMFGGLA